MPCHHPYSLFLMLPQFKIMWAMKPTQYLGVMCSLSWASLLLTLLLLDVVFCGRLLLAFYIYCGCQSNQFSLVHYIKDSPHIYIKKKIMHSMHNRPTLVVFSSELFNVIWYFNKNKKILKICMYCKCSMHISAQFVFFFGSFDSENMMRCQ